MKQLQNSISIEDAPKHSTLADFGLDGVDCDKCGNTGFIITNRGDYFTSKECECMKVRRSMRSIRNSGLSDMLGRYTFDNYETPDDWRKKIKELAENFVKNDEGWFFISGRSGSGKSHICTAICKELIGKGEEVRYVIWRDESVALKACIMDREQYENRIEKLKRIHVLYIDDFWKGDITEADIKLTFEILNARYNDSKKRTIISTEMSLPDIIKVDEAIGGRIYERSRGFHMRAPEENWRLRK